MSSDFTSQNIIFTNELQRPGATLGAILASDISGIFQLVPPPADNMMILSDSGQVSGVKWDPATDFLWSVSGSSITPISSATRNRFVLCDSSNTLENRWATNGIILSSTLSILRITEAATLILPDQGSVIASNNSILDGSLANGGNMLETCIIASNGSFIIGDRSDQCFIGASIDSIIQTSLGSGNGTKVIIGCDNCDYSSARISFLACQNLSISTGQNDMYSSYISCNDITDIGLSNGNFNTILSSTTTTIITTSSRCLVKSTNASIGHNGVVVLSDDDSSGVVLTTSAVNSFLTRFTGGVRFYTDAALTTYADLAPGSGSWVAVSDRNVKENIIEVNYDDILRRVRELPVYEYNFIGNPKEVKCIGPMAQDWHKYVTPLETYTDIIDNPDKDGGKIEVEKDAKNKLGIEEMDSIGVCLSSIKSLDKKVQILTKINELKKQKIKILEDKIREMMTNF